jgi:hypothetical protein
MVDLDRWPFFTLARQKQISCFGLKIGTKVLIEVKEGVLTVTPETGRPLDETEFDPVDTERGTVERLKEVQ